MALQTGADASAPASAAERASAALWAPLSQHAAWKRTICSPPVRPEVDPVVQREDAALLQDFAAMQVRESGNRVAEMRNIYIYINKHPFQA